MTVVSAFLVINYNVLYVIFVSVIFSLSYCSHCAVILTISTLSSIWNNLYRANSLYVAKWKNHFPRMKGDVGMSHHNKSHTKTESH